MTASPPSPARLQEQSRGGLILALGIIAVIMLGPFTGIPAWIMGNKDLKKIHAGTIPITSKGITTTGMVLGIIGTFISIGFYIILGIIFVVGISTIGTSVSQFRAHDTQANKDGVTSSLVNIAANAYQYKIRPSTMGGGGGSYVGYEIPFKMRSDDMGTYELNSDPTETELVLTGKSKVNEEWRATCFIDQNGYTIFRYDGW